MKSRKEDEFNLARITYQIKVRLVEKTTTEFLNLPLVPEPHCFSWGTGWRVSQESCHRSMPALCPELDLRQTLVKSGP